MLNVFYYFRIIDADADVFSMGECWVFIEQTVWQSAAISNPSLREIEEDRRGVAECCEELCAVAGHDVNIKFYVSPAHVVEEGVLGWFAVLSHVSLISNEQSIHPLMT